MSSVSESVCVGWGPADLRVCVYGVEEKSTQRDLCPPNHFRGCGAAVCTVFALLCKGLVVPGILPLGPHPQASFLSCFLPLGTVLSQRLF